MRGRPGLIALVLVGTASEARAVDQAQNPDDSALVRQLLVEICTENPEKFASCPRFLATEAVAVKVPESQAAPGPQPVANPPNGGAGGASPQAPPVIAPQLTPATGNVPPSKATESDKQVAKTTEAERSAASATIGAPGSAGTPSGNNTSGWQFGASSDTGKISLTYNLDTNAKPPILTSEPAVRKIVSFTASATVPSTDSATQLSSIDTLLPAKSLNFKFTIISNPVAKWEKAATNFVNSYYGVNQEKICLKYTDEIITSIIIKYKLGKPSEYSSVRNSSDFVSSMTSNSGAFQDLLGGNYEAKKAIESLAKTPLSPPCIHFRFQNLQNVILQYIKDNGGAGTSLSKYAPAIIADLAEIDSKMQKEQEESFQNSTNTKGPIPVDQFAFVPIIAASIDGTLGYTKYDYYDPNNLSSGSVTRALYAVGLDGYYMPEGNLSLSAGYHYQVGYKAGSASKSKQATICLNGNTVTLKCETGYFGPPASQIGDVIDAEIRWVPSIFGQKIGLAPKLNYDFLSKVYQVKLPIYLAPKDSSSGLLTGGIEADYASDTKATVGIFVTTPLCVFAATSCGSSAKNSTSGGSNSPQPGAPAGT